MNIKKIAFIGAISFFIYKYSTGENQDERQKQLQAIVTAASIAYLIHGAVK